MIKVKIFQPQRYGQDRLATNEYLDPEDFGLLKIKPFKHHESGRNSEEKQQTGGKIKGYVDQMLSSIGSTTATFERLLGF